jgi:hypothetical protein
VCSTKILTTTEECNHGPWNTIVAAGRTDSDHSAACDVFASLILQRRKFRPEIPKESIVDLILVLILLLLVFGGGGGLYWGLGAGWGIGPIGLIILVVAVALLLNGYRGRGTRL